MPPFHLQRTPDLIATLEDGRGVFPVATLRDGQGNTAHFYEENGGYVLVTSEGVPDGRVRPVTHWPREAWEASRNLPTPRTT